MRRLIMAVASVLVVAGSAAAQWSAVEEAKLTASSAASGAKFGASVATDGDTVVVGEPFTDIIGSSGLFDQVSGLAFAPGTSTLYGSDRPTKQLLTIDRATGAGTPVGVLAPRKFDGLAYDPMAGTLYGSGLKNTVSNLYTLDPQTGAATNVGPMGFAQVRGLAFDPGSGTLYGSDNVTDQLITIDTATGAGTAVGPLGFERVLALAFDAGTNTLYGCDATKDQLITIDPTTGQGTAVGPIGFGDIAGLAFDAGANTLYATDIAVDVLVAINPAIGAGISVGWLTGNGGPFVNAGSAYVFDRSGTIWSESAKLVAATPMASESFGAAVAIDGDTIAVGAPGHDAAGISGAGAAYVFTRIGSGWGQQTKLLASIPKPDHHFGAAVAIDGDTLVIGAPRSSGAKKGNVHVFVRSGTIWKEQATLIRASSEFGASVDIDGDRLIAGAPGDYEGVVYIYIRAGTTWSMEKKLEPRPPPVFYWGDRFGHSVGLSGDRAFVGSPNDVLPAGSFGGGYQGSVHVFQHTGKKWRWQTGLTKTMPVYSEWFGRSVSIDGNVAVVGAPGHDAGFNGAGLAFVFAQTGATWRQVKKIKPPDLKIYDRFGVSVSIAGDTVVVGAEGDNHSGLKDAGSAYVYRISSPAPKSYCQAGTSASGCTATVGVSGSPSATAPSGFFLTAQNVEGARAGLFIYSGGPKHKVPWGNGTSFRCTTPPVSRSGPLPVSGTLGACDGSFSLDLNALWCPTCPKAASNPGEGAGVQVQLWYRDPLSTSNQATSFSDAVEFWVGP